MNEYAHNLQHVNGCPVNEDMPAYLGEDYFNGP